MMKMLLPDGSYSEENLNKALLGKTFAVNIEKRSISEMKQH